MEENIQFTLNGKPTSLSVDPNRTLLWVLRTDLQLTGTKYGCGEGYCGACTVLVDDAAYRSCEMTMREVAGTAITTIEGLAQSGTLHPVQKAFVAHDALQCGYCTPGMVLTAVSLLRRNPHPSRQEIIDGMDDNLCRCGAYTRIVQAVADVTEAVDGGQG